MLSQRVLEMLKSRVLINIAGWLLFAGIFYAGISGVEASVKSLLIVLSVFLPAVPAVYLHLYVFEKFLKTKKYLIYFTALVAIALSFGWLVEFMAQEVVYYDDPDAFISGKLTLVAFLVVSTGFRSFFEGLRAKSQLAEIEAKQAKAELDSLKSQVNPHFLFNSLNNIYGLLMEDKDKAGDSLLTLSSLLRYLIYASQKSQISLEEEIKFLDDYMAMERLRLGDKCKLSFEKEGNFANRSVSPFLLIPFVENAFKHGSFATVGDSFIVVRLSIQDERLHFTVRNSVKSTVHSHASSGTGIANVKRRLELLMPGKYRLETVRDVSEFNVNLELEL